MEKMDTESLIYHDIDDATFYTVVDRCFTKVRKFNPLSVQQKKHVCERQECNNETNLKRCGSCKSVVYCSKTCQQKDWKSHKMICAIGKEKNYWGKQIFFGSDDQPIFFCSENK